jgi:hypothetical protein
MGDLRGIFVVLALGVTGCLGTDTDLTQPIDTGVLQSPKVPTTLRVRIEQSIHDRTTWVEAPELCATCTATVDPDTATAFDDRDGSVLVTPDKSWATM